MATPELRMERFVSIAKILAALGNPTRLALVQRLSTAETFGGQSICELAEGTGLSRQAVTKHLEALADVGLVSRRKLGRATWYELKGEPVSRAIVALTAVVQQRAQCEEKLSSFKERFLAGTQ